MEETHHLASSCTTFNHIALSCIILHDLASSCIILHHLASPCIALHRLALSYIILHRLALSCSVLHHLALLHILLHHLAASCIVLHYHHLAKFFQFDSRCLLHPRHPTHCHHKTTIILQHATFVTILVCPTGPALEVPRHPAIERAALQPQTTSCPVHGQHSEPVPFCEAPLQKFLPGHPGAIHDPWSQHCYAAPATEVPRHRTTRMTRSHAPFAQTFPSANETATTKRPQTSRVRDFNQTFCIQKFRDMHICSLAFKKMP